MAKQTKPPAKDREARRPAKAKPATKTSPAKGKAGKGAPAKAGGRPATVEAYLASLPEDRRAAVAAVRDAVNRALPSGYEEGIAYGMIGWHVPHRLYPAGYHCDPKQPLPFAGLGATKSHLSLYFFGLYCSPAERERFQAEWKKTGKKLDMGAACIRFKRLEDAALDVIAGAVRRLKLKPFLSYYEQVRPENKKPGAPSKKASSQSTGSKAAAKPGAAAGGKRSSKPSTRRSAAKPSAAKPAAKRPRKRA